MTILVDNRAGSKELVRFPPLDTIGELCHLDSADACFPGNGPAGSVIVGVEVKSLWDVLSSAATGRLQATQLPAMLETYDTSWLLYYGVYRFGHDGALQIRKKGTWVGFSIGKRSVPVGYLEHLLLDLVATGVHVKLVADAREAAAWIGCLYRWWSKPWTGHKGLKTFDHSQDLTLMPGVDPRTYLRARVASQLPGVGFTRAMAVAQHFPSVRSMVNAGRAEWAKVDGVGKVIAGAVEEALK